MANAQQKEGTINSTNGQRLIFRAFINLRRTNTDNSMKEYIMRLKIYQNGMGGTELAMTKLIFTNQPPVDVQPDQKSYPGHAPRGPGSGLRDRRVGRGKGDQK